jgi:CHAT domain-containing protein/tetratricopeptide (TPR) repeat protein
MTTDRFHCYVIAAMLFIGFVAMRSDGAVSQTRDLIELDNRLNALWRAGKLGEAIPLAEQLLQKSQRRLGSEHPATAVALNSLASLLTEQGRETEAEPLYQRAIAILEKRLGHEDRELATPIKNLALLYCRQKRFEQAEPLARRSVAISEKALGPEDPEVVAALDVLGEVIYSRGRYSEAEAILNRSYAIHEKAHGPNDPGIASTLNLIATVYYYQGRIAEAVQFTKRAVDIREKALGPEHPSVIDLVENLAGLYGHQGRDADAEALDRRVVAIREKTLGPEHPSLAAALYNLAIIYGRQGRYSEAETLYKRSLAINEKAFGREDLRVAQDLWGLESVLSKQGRYAEAEPILKRVLATYERALPDTHPTVSDIINALGFLYRQMGRDMDAEPLYRRSLATREKSLPDNHPEIAVNLANIAALELRQGRDLDSLHTIRRANAIVTQRRLNVKKSADDRLLNNDWFFTHHVRAAFRVAERDKANAASLMQEAFSVAQWANDTAASSALSQMAARLATGNPALVRLVRERQDFEGQWEQVDKSLTSSLSLPQERRAGADERARTRLTEIDARLTAIDTRLKAEFPRYFELVRGELVASDEVARLLDADEALLQFTFTKEEGFVWLITRSTQEWARIELDARTLYEKFSALDCGLDPSDWDDDSNRDQCRKLVGAVPDKNGFLPFDVAKAHELYTILLGPFAHEIKGKRLLIAGFPVGLPIAVLVTEKPSEALPKTVEGYRDINWLGSQHAITTLPSVASLRALRMLAKAERAPELFIGFGDPALGGNPSCGKPSVPASCPGTPGGIGQRVASLLGTTPTRSTHRAVTRAPLQGLFEENLANVEVLRAQCPLPETSFELKCVAQSLGVPESQIQVREKATETAVKTAPLERYQIVHFATHGLLASETKEATGSLAEPALMLTPPATATESDDGLLTASEIAQLKLNADWVVLSACNTAGSSSTASGEALSGLARAFFYAGARSLLVSDWAVDSDAAVLLITHAFAELSQNPSIGRAEALRRSMQAVIKDTSRPGTAHPSFWAPFVVVGEGGAGR